GCSAPVAVNAKINDENVTVKAMLGYPDGTHIIHKELSAKVNTYETLGKELATMMIEEDALNILEKAESIAFKNEMPERL
ncbi:MAG: hydroxymethylbilane synthase, partial [Sulfurovum sp.]|nr:hydroxymethylbilane synthase [Sulfurovum sp.]